MFITAYAQSCQLFNATGCKTFQDTVNNFAIPTIQTIVIGLAAIFLLVGAIQYVTSGTEKDGAKKAQETLTNAAIGLVIALIVVVILNIIRGVVGNTGVQTGQTVVEVDGSKSGEEKK